MAALVSATGQESTHVNEVMLDGNDRSRRSSHPGIAGQETLAEIETASIRSSP